ncbi:transcriptional regulator PAI 2-type [Annulohypoxylon moriforme]|nr:transcriptional regulator PAI 2-type [Annulohypoxylon moriforme]
MYLRGVHTDATIPMLRQLIRQYPLGILTTAIASRTYPLIQSSHIPFVLDVENESDENELGVLRGHLARPNPQSKALIEAVQLLPVEAKGVLEQEVMVLFTSPIQHYVTPKFYTETKPNTGKVVPTWNYAAAQAYGKAKIYWDHKDQDSISFLSKQISDLSRHAEESLMGFDGTENRPGAWRVTDAPDRFIELLQKNIIGIEVRIDRLEGKFKMSQEMQKGDREGVIRGFETIGSDVGIQMAEIVKQRGDLKDAKVLA